MSVQKTNGSGIDNVTVPVTFVPIDLTGQVPRAQLLASSDFRRAVTSQALRLIREDDAEKALGQNGAQAEISRLAEEHNAVVSASARLTTGTENPEAETSTLSPRIAQFLTAVEESQDSVAILNTLRSMGDLVEAEYKAIGNVARDKRGFDEVAQYCEERIEDLKI